MRVAGFRPAVPLFPNLLHLLKGVDVDDGRLGVVKDRLVLHGVLSGRLVPDRVCVGLEVDRICEGRCRFSRDRYSIDPIIGMLYREEDASLEMKDPKCDIEAKKAVLRRRHKCLPKF